MKTICIFGDSIVWGATDTAGGGWAERLKNDSEKHNLPYEIYVLGVSGDTSENLLQRFESETKARNPDIIIIAIGTNDSAYRKEIDDTVVPVNPFKANILTIIQKAQTFTKNIVVIGLPKVDEEKTIPYADSTTGKCYINANLKKYSETLKEISIEKKIPYIDVFDVLSVSDFDDGLHPNSLGHEKLFKHIKTKLFEYTIFRPSDSTPIIEE